MGVNAMFMGVPYGVLYDVGIIDDMNIPIDVYGKEFMWQFISYQVEALKARLTELGTSIERYKDDGYVVERKVHSDGGDIEILIYKKTLVNTARISIGKPSISITK